MRCVIPPGVFHHDLVLLSESAVRFAPSKSKNDPLGGGGVLVQVGGGGAYLVKNSGDGSVHPDDEITRHGFSTNQN
jgi:hypothetical protein